MVNIYRFDKSCTKLIFHNGTTGDAKKECFKTGEELCRLDDVGMRMHF